MVYRFSLGDKNVKEGVRRIACEQLDLALARLGSEDRASAEAIHEVRKCIKRLRGLLRLIKPGFADFRAENTALRDTGRGLAHLRDTDVLLLTLRALTKDKQAFPVLHEALRQGHRAARDPAQTRDTLDACQTALAALRDRAAKWDIDGKDFDTPRRGLKLTHLATQTSLRQVQAGPDDDLIHDWRKRVKDSFYQMQLIEPVWPALLAPRVHAIDSLGDMLGIHHDLSVLLAQAQELPLPKSEAKSIAAAIATKQSDIIHTALPLGGRLYAGDARAMADQWSAWWTIWRDSKG